MLMSEFVNMGGNQEDYAKANDIYTELDLWLDRHEFMVWWQEFGGDTNNYIELLNAVKIARKVNIDTDGLYKQRETMLKYVINEALKTEKAIEELTMKVERLKIIRNRLMMNAELYNR